MLAAMALHSRLTKEIRQGPQGPEVGAWRRKWATQNRRKSMRPQFKRKSWPYV